MLFWSTNERGWWQFGQEGVGGGESFFFFFKSPVRGRRRGGSASMYNISTNVTPTKNKFKKQKLWAYIEMHNKGPHTFETKSNTVGMIGCRVELHVPPPLAPNTIFKIKGKHVQKLERSDWFNWKKKSIVPNIQWRLSKCSNPLVKDMTTNSNATTQNSSIQDISNKDNVLPTAFHHP